MTEKQLIAKIKELRQIKPREDWVFLAKKEILGEEKSDLSLFSFIGEIKREIRFAFSHKFAFASLIILIVLAGTFAISQKSLPGDKLFSLKKITEKGQAIFVSEGEQSKHNLQLANKRLDDLTKIAESNRVENLALAINEFQASVSEVVKSLTEEEVKQDKEKVKEIVLEIKKLEENKQKVEALGVVIGETEELDNVLAQLVVEREIKDLEGQVLTEKQQEVLNEARGDYENGEYFQALEKILILSQ